MRIQLLLFYLAITIISFGQKTVIKGDVVICKNNFNIEYASIYFDSLTATVSDINGKFLLEKENIDKNDTLKIRYIGMYDLNIINLPKSKDTIVLNNIPLFEYFSGHSMSHCICKWYHFRCKKQCKILIKNEEKRIADYYSMQDSTIKAYNFIFEGKIKKIDISTNCLNLN